MRKIFTLILLIATAKLNAQDIIVKKNQDEIKSKVLEISEDVIKYKKWGMQEGPTYSINAADVFMIIYQNGTREIIKANTKNSTEEEDQNQNSNNRVSKKTTVIEDNSASSEKDEDYVWYPQFVYVKKKDKYVKPSTFGDFGIELRNLIGAKAPNIYIHPQIFIAKNVAIDLMNQNTFSTIQFPLGKMTIWGSTTSFGIAYFLNSAFKLDKSKASIYVAPRVGFSQAFAFGEGSDSFNSPLGVDVNIGLGARYHITQKVGLHTEINTNLKSVAINLGISILRIKDNNYKNSLSKKKSK